MKNAVILIEAISNGYSVTFSTFVFSAGDTGSLLFIKAGNASDDWRALVIWDRDKESRGRYVDLQKVKIRGIRQNGQDLLLH